MGYLLNIYLKFILLYMYRFLKALLENRLVYMFRVLSARYRVLNVILFLTLFLVVCRRLGRPRQPSAHAAPTMPDVPPSSSWPASS